ncbi:MAG: molybdenum ABC transporter ATP-binding protein [Desulfobacteraceae bacterium]|nr:molybdenum ABC transporter ATP-binding protein [Desulfobacteraceae bacterium]
MIDINIQRQHGSFCIQAAFNQQQSGVTALFGPSGAGKTSIINMVAGLIKPDSGHIIINGVPLYDSSKRINLPLEKRRIGYVFQDARLFPHLPVRSNLTYGMRLTPASERFIRFDDVVDLLGIGNLLNRGPCTLSGGEKQRVAIGRALLTSPALLLMDEPLASLDNSRKQEVLPFIECLCKAFSLPVLYVSHCLDEILNMAQYLVLLDQGKVKANGPIESLVNSLDMGRHISPSDFGSVIKAVVKIQKDQFGLAHLKFPGGVLKVPDVHVNSGDTLRVRIPARAVAVAFEKPRKSSFRNIYPASILEIADEGNGFHGVCMNAGFPLLARITSHSVEKLGLKPGLKVFALIKSVNISSGGSGNGFK